MKTKTTLITLLASVTLLTACGNNQKPEEASNKPKEPQTEQTTPSTKTSKTTKTSETTEQAANVTHGVYIVTYSDYMERYHPQIGGTYSAGTKAFFYTKMTGKNYVHSAVIPLKSYDAGVAIFESQREATLFTQWLNSVNDKNTMTYDMQTNINYFYENVYTNY